MSVPFATRPETDEYMSYYERYISLVSESDVLAVLSRQLEDIRSLTREFTEEKAGLGYEPDKWSVKEVVGHMIDTERILSYRALCIARGETASLPGFEQDDYVRAANFNRVKLADLAAELEHVREATRLLFAHLDEGAWTRRGVANGNEVSVRALAFIIAGHTIHHLTVLRTRYR